MYKKNKTLILISNQGLHPVIPKINKKYKDKLNLIFSEVTVGNTPLSLKFASEVAKKTKNILMKYHDCQIKIVWSGMPVYNLVIYNVVKKVSGKNPIILVYNNVIQDYEEFNLDPRFLIFEF